MESFSAGAYEICSSASSSAWYCVQMHIAAVAQRSKVPCQPRHRQTHTRAPMCSIHACLHALQSHLQPSARSGGLMHTPSQVELMAPSKEKVRSRLLAPIFETRPPFCLAYRCLASIAEGCCGGAGGAGEESATTDAEGSRRCLPACGMEGIQMQKARDDV